MTQGIQEQSGLVTAIESERHLFAVGLKMLRAKSVPAAYDAALQERECRFDRIGVDVAFGVDAEFVPNRLVSAIFAEMLGRAPIGVEIVCEQDVYILTDILSDVLFERSRLRVCGMKEPKITAALTDADNDFFVIKSCALAFSPVLSANVGFVHLDLPGEHFLLALDHRGADAVAEIPCRLVAHAERTLNLAGRHSFLGFAQQERCEKPFRKRQVRVVKNCASGHSELVVTVFAVVERLFGFEFSSGHLASRALDTFRPAQAGKQFAALFVSGKQGIHVN